MENISFKIQGGQIPNGSVRISGAKNAATRLMAAALISNEDVLLENFPTRIVDAFHKANFISNCGGEVLTNHDKETVLIKPEKLRDTLLGSYNYPIRTTYLLAAGLIKKSGSAKIPYPGGCKIGQRGYDLHIMVWEKLGAKVSEKPDFIEIFAPKGFSPGEINFPISTTGGTENALICASTIAGETVIRNAYISPEIENLIDFLRTLGAKIQVAGNSFIKVAGSDYLKGSIFPVIPDRIEALTWIVYGALSGGSLTIKDVPFNAMQIPLIHLKEAGIDFFQNQHNVKISPDCLLDGIIQPYEIATGTHPGVISDMQAFYVLLALHADGISRVYDYRYPDRTKYLEELSKFYPGQLKWEKGKITIIGKKNVTPVPENVRSTDLRGSMALVLAALLAKGESTIENVEMALRGYNNLESKLKSLGVSIKL